jgi:hypothetical protein
MARDHSRVLCSSRELDTTHETRTSGDTKYSLLADALNRRGFAVLRYDKRGVGSSSGDYDAAATADFGRPSGHNRCRAADFNQATIRCPCLHALLVPGPKKKTPPRKYGSKMEQ